MKYLSKKIAIAFYTKNDDNLYKKKEFQKLSDLCEKVIAENFNYYPKLTGLNEISKRNIYDNMSFNFPLDILTDNINYEGYWHRIYKTYFDCNPESPDNETWKKTFLQRYINEILNKEFTEEMHNDIKFKIKATKEYITSITIHKLSYDLDLYFLLNALQHLEYLELTYCNVSINDDSKKDYVENVYGMRYNEAEIISEAIQKLKNLKVLKLPGNYICDDILKILSNGIKNCSTIEELDLSYNNISDTGARIISKLIIKGLKIKKLNLANNEISYEGSRYISLMLKSTDIIENLNLKVNYINDEALRNMLADISNNSSLRELDISSNLIGNGVAEELSQFINNDVNNIELLYLNGNLFTDESYETLLIMLKKNSKIKYFKIGQTKISKDNVKRLEDVVIDKRFEAEDIPYKS